MSEKKYSYVTQPLFLTLSTSVKIQQVVIRQGLRRIFTYFPHIFRTAKFHLSTHFIEVSGLGLAMPQFLLMRIDAHQMRINAHIPHQ